MPCMKSLKFTAILNDNNNMHNKDLKSLKTFCLATVVLKEKGSERPF